jgi:MFS family permease
MRSLGWPESWQSAAAALGLALALGLGSILKARLLCRLLDAPVQGWRWPLLWAAAAAIAVGAGFTWLPPRLEWLQLALGIPAILLAFGFVVWKRGFTHDDRVLFRMKKGEKPEYPTSLGVTPPDAEPPVR